MKKQLRIKIVIFLLLIRKRVQVHYWLIMCTWFRISIIDEFFMCNIIILCVCICASVDGMKLKKEEFWEINENELQQDWVFPDAAILLKRIHKLKKKKWGNEEWNIHLICIMLLRKKLQININYSVNDIKTRTRVRWFVSIIELQRHNTTASNLSLLNDKFRHHIIQCYNKSMCLQYMLVFLTIIFLCYIHQKIQIMCLLEQK